LFELKYTFQLLVYGSSNSYSGGSYNLSTDSFALGYTPSTGGGQASFDVSTSYENSPTQYGGVQTTSGFSPSSSIATAYATSNYGQTNPTFNQSAINLHNHVNYSPNSSSNFSSNYGGPNTSYAQTGNLVDDPIFDAQRKSIGDQLKQLDEQLLNKVSELHMVKQQINRTTSTLQNGYAMNKGQSTIEIDKKHHAKSQKLTNSCKDMTTTDKEVFY
jgi:angiomotin like